MAALDLLGTDDPCTNPQCARCAPKWEMLQLPTRGLCAFCRARAVARLKQWQKLGSQPEALVVSDFETQPEINKWVIQVGSMTLSTDSRYVTHGRGSAKVTIPTGNDYPGVVMNTEHGMPADWRKYDFAHVVFQPKQMSPEELFEGARKVARQYYSVPDVIRRAARAMWRTKKFAGVLPAGTNYTFRRYYKRDFKF
jgi:hypothetical protein